MKGGGSKFESKKLMRNVQEDLQREDVRKTDDLFGDEEDGGFLIYMCFFFLIYMRKLPVVCSACM
ncbi:hypothetical protein BUALT_Bualt05G0070000 [Buddleja alternifolia]|uniref:Uncharacterized protein n=1 Tax=Buddleja alternifolia TaxID=168488 RepID=A0AAV6XP77_9LAMI|nr:hypothetical protein BUALT_Bualt05G0070000 [Buddleja alternifolia]